MSPRKTVTDPDHAKDISSLEHVWIPMPDGTRLSARIWRPADEQPVPAILEYIPYRKRDLVRLRDERNHPFLARHGYVCLRVDMRGSGDSEGHMPDMYDQHELDDARHVIKWIADQPWCNGRVGMFGTSWGGTASLQAAVRAPGPLKAVLANCATINRFEDDIHWMGGCLLTDSLEWGATLPSILASPPDAATVGEQWFAQWQERLSQLTLPFENWACHDRRDEFWRHGSVAFETDHLTCPVLMIGGWADRYANNVMKLVQARPDLCRGIVGPWGHHYPDKGEPAPAMDFQALSLAWWDHWLKDDADEMPLSFPLMRVWRRAFDPPQDRLARREGNWLVINQDWVAEDQDFYIADGALLTSPVTASGIHEVPFDLRHGECAGDTGYFGRVGGLPLDQSPDDQRACCFDTAELNADLDLLGHAVLTVQLAASCLPAQIACRLCEVTPEGVSNLVTRTVLNLTLDDCLEEPRPLEPGKMHAYRITFPSMAYRFSKGNRIRLALGASYWPLVWPPSQAVDLNLSTEDARLSLPQPPQHAAEITKPFAAPQDHQGDTAFEIVSAGPLERGMISSAGGITRQFWQQPQTTTRFPDLGFSLATATTADYRSTDDDPASVCCQITNQHILDRPDGTAVIDSSITMQASISGYAVTTQLTACWNDEIMLEKHHVFDHEKTAKKGG